MNIQIFGKSKCFETKKAERFFKERGIKFQYIDLVRYGYSPKEFDTILRGVGGIDRLIDWDCKKDVIQILRYSDDVHGKEDRLYDDPSLARTPIVRNGKEVTVGYCPEIWLQWK